MSTPQEEFWAGEFGDAYIDRNNSPSLLASNTALFATILARTGPLRSVVELGANIGMNIQALRRLLPDAELTAVEINARAASECRKLDCEVIEDSILSWTPDRTYDLAFTKTVLIHIEPGHLPEVYDTLDRASGRFVLIAEYYNPTPMTIPYRGHTERLFKRDFAGEMLDRHPDFHLVDHGFCYHRAAFPQDDITWFLLERA